MIRKLLLWGVVVAVCVAIGVWIWSTAAANRIVQRPWPGTLGTLADAPKRYPPVAQSAGATELVRLAAKVGLDLAAARMPFPPNDPGGPALTEHAKKQVEQSGTAIDAPPAEVANYLSHNAAAYDAIRDHLLSGQPIVWESNFTAEARPSLNFPGHMRLHRVLVVRALEKARREDSSAWDELRASWELSRGLWSRPELTSHLVGVATARMTNKAARKLPLPAPAWFNEVLTFDYLGAFASSQQAEAWTLANAYDRASPKAMARNPDEWLQYPKAIEMMRQYAGEVMLRNPCDTASLPPPPVSDIPNLLNGWERIVRFREELEETRRALQLTAKPSCGR